MTDKQYLEANEKALENIEHIVVLMLENRSFDNLLGWLYDGVEVPDGQIFEGLNESMWNPLNNIDTDGNPFVEKVSVAKNGMPRTIGRKKRSVKEDFTLPAPDPGEGYKDTNAQLFGVYKVDDIYPPAPTNMGFVNNYKDAMLYGTYSFGDAPTDPRDIMVCYTPEQTPVLSTLAKEFAVCDHWHCSVPSQTLPNRDFVHAASSSGNVNNKPNDTCNARTVFNQLQDAIDGGRNELSWGVYSGTSKGKAFSLTRTIMTQLHDIKYNDNFYGIDQFYKDAKAGSLPSYSFLEPQFSGPDQNDQHPPQDIRYGDKLIADVYNAVLQSPKWENTLLVITYDEHGGCFDHVAPPNGAKSPIEGAGEDGFRFNRFGVRVPTVLISPLIKKGCVARPAGWTPFDHASVISTVRKTFKLDKPLNARDEAAPDLGCVLTLTTARKDKPEVKPLALPKQIESSHVNDLHRMAEDALHSVTGTKRKEDHSIHDYIHETYHDHFYAKKSSKDATDKREVADVGA
ncbi:MAG: phospholipase C [Chlamydiales bacterium]|jgi:phospholipase C